MNVRLLKSINNVQTKCARILQTRCYCVDNGYEKGENLRPPGGLKTYIVKKYVSYIERCQIKAKEDYPKFYKIYRLFKDGIVEFFNDTKLYSVIATRIWAGQKLTAFTWKELEIYRQMPSDLLRSAPVLIAAPLPAVPYFFYPVCYMFPRQLLCRHFWTVAQREKFGIHYLQQRLRYYPRVLELIERHSVNVQDVLQKRLLEEILFKLEHGRHPTVEELLEVKQLFTRRPFGIRSMTKLQRFYVARSLNFSTLSLNRFKNDAVLLHHIDLALIREGLDKLTLDELKQSCFYRGYNAEKQTEAELKAFLKQWLHLSEKIDDKSLSLLLHAPVLLSYNKPSNRKYLIHEIDIRGNVLR